MPYSVQKQQQQQQGDAVEFAAGFNSRLEVVLFTGPVWMPKQMQRVCW
jgi:hypothetical protein